MTMKPDQLLSLFTEHFNMTEFEGLCFDLGVKHEEILGHNQTISGFARNIILYFARDERLPALIERCRELRPEAPWPDEDSLPDFSVWHEAEIGEKELENYLAWVQTQYNTMRVLSMTQPLSLQTIYTDVFLLNKSKYEQKQGIEELEQAFAGRKGLGGEEKRIQGGELLAQANRFFIMGQPGAGKTTFSKWLVLQAAQNYVEEQRIPIYLTLRRFNTWDESLLTILAHELEFGDIVAATEKLRGLLRQGKLLILLDGLDEVLTEHRNALNDQIDDLVKWSDENQIVITCRSHAETRQFESFGGVRIADFNEDQVEHFVRHWFDDSNLANSLLRELKRAEHESIRELARTPLLLALLCIGYGHEPSFPKRKDQLYKQALQVVLQQWDEERGIRRESIYGQLSLEKKQTLLAYVAYTTFSQGQLFIAEADLTQHIVDFWQNWRQEEIERQKAEYGQVYPPELPQKEIVPQKIIWEIAAQHGLLVEQLTSVYSFSHLTLQEYFAALYIVENENRGSVEQLMPFVDDYRWRELFLLTAGMLADATEFFELFLQALEQMIANDEQVLTCLKWVEEESERNQLLYKPAAVRAFLLSSALHYARTHSSAQVIASALDPDLACAIGLDSILTFTNVLDLDLDRDLPAHIIVFPIPAHTFVSFFARSLALALKVSRQLNLNNMQTALQQLTASDIDIETAPEKGRLLLNKLVDTLDKYRDDWDLHRKVQPGEWEIAPFWQLSKVQLDELTDYYYANLLLVHCLEVAYVPNRQAIEDRILLPPS